MGSIFKEPREVGARGEDQRVYMAKNGVGEGDMLLAPLEEASLDTVITIVALGLRNGRSAPDGK